MPIGNHQSQTSSLAARFSAARRRLGVWVPAVTALVLGGILWHQWGELGRSPSPEQVSAHTVLLTERLPQVVGPWVGRSWDPPDPARPLLRRVHHRGKIYENVQTGHRVAILIVQGAGRRDLLGYTPSRWYADRGWRGFAERAGIWQIAGFDVPVIEQEFSAPGREGPEQAPLGEAGGQLIVTSFAVHSDGRLSATLDPPEVFSAAAEPSSATAFANIPSGSFASRHDGATALVKAAFPGDTPLTDRREAMNRLTRGVILSIQNDKGVGAK